MASVLDLAKYVQDQGNAGRLQGQQSRLGALASKVYTAPREERPGLYSQMATVSPDAAGNAQKLAEALDADTHRQLAQHASLLIAAPSEQRAQMYPAIADLGRKAGLPIPEGGWDEKYLPGMEKLAGLAGGGDEMKSLRIGANGNYWAIRGGQFVDTGVKADPRTQLRDQPGVAPGIVDLRTGAVSPLQEGGAPPAAAGGREVPFSIDPSLPPQVQAAIRQSEAAGQPVPDHITVAPGAGLAAPRPAVSPAEAERLRLAQEANARAAEAAALAKRGTAPAGFRFKEDGSLEAIPGGPKPAGSAATEDERKAAGWLAQASNAFQNMERALRADKDADEPGFIETYSPIDEVGNLSRSPTRQQYVQASSSFGEAVLRAATGAGVNKEEAVQKARELTPQRGDSEAVRKQKREALTVYLSSLRQRAGRAAPQAPAAPQVGEVRRGYRYKGGDPAQQTSWEPAR